MILHNHALIFIKILSTIILWNNEYIAGGVFIVSSILNICVTFDNNEQYSRKEFDFIYIYFEIVDISLNQTTCVNRSVYLG